MVVKDILLDTVGVPFSRTIHGELDFTREGAHSVARIVHSADATGRAIETALLARLASEKNVTLFTEATAIDLITARHHSRDVAQRYALQDPCLGAYVLDGTGGVHTVLADFTVLATGGVGRLFLHTTNTRHAIGGGLAMAERAGAATLNLEYVQFHPTTLYHPDAEGFLISEALRGEGAVLVNRAGEAVHAALRSGAQGPRAARRRDARDRRGDDVARRALRLPRPRAPLPRPRGTEHQGAFPDDREDVREVRHRHRDRADPRRARGALPLRGGPRGPRRKDDHPAPLRRGRGVLHGRARGEPPRVDVLARGPRLGRGGGQVHRARTEGGRREPANVFRAIPDWESPGDAQNEDPALLQQDWATIRNTMWNYVGIVRTTARLARAVADLRDLEKRILRFYQVTRISKEIVDLFHGVRAAHLIATAAFKNPVSRGCHYRKS